VQAALTGAAFFYTNLSLIAFATASDLELM
jgi:hypothetical protein